MAITRLGLYNIALAAVGESSLSTLTDSVEARRLLDEVYTRGNGAVQYFLEQGHWNFALRAVKLDSSSDVTRQFGFSYAFLKPDDFVRLNMISADEYFSLPLTRYEPEGSYFHADVDPLYLRYVSDDADYGGDFSKWPETFSLWAGHWLATQIAPRMTNDVDKEALKKETKKLLIDARSKDASEEPTRFEPLSSWASSRLGGRGRRDRGNRGQLIG